MGSSCSNQSNNNVQLITFNEVDIFKIKTRLKKYSVFFYMCLYRSKMDWDPTRFT